MSGIGWPSHDNNEKARIAQCYTDPDPDQPDECPLCIARVEADRLRERLDQFEAYAITVANALADRDRNAVLGSVLRRIVHLSREALADRAGGKP